MKHPKMPVILAVAATVAAGILWTVQGCNIYTKTSQPVTITDDMFGTSSVVWQSGLWLGLDVLVPTLGVCLAATLGYWWYMRRRSAM